MFECMKRTHSGNRERVQAILLTSVRTRFFAKKPGSGGMHARGYIILLYSFDRKLCADIPF